MMRTVVREEHGVIGLNWQWLPTWVGMNTVLAQEINAAVSSKLVGRALDEETLDYADELVIDFICQKVSLPGVREYLEGLKFVQDPTA